MLKKEKGITLIALIITIIVMLILVGVTINVALNGGLFEKAEDAKEQTQLASEKEQLMMAALGSFDLNTGVDFDNIDLPEGFEEVSKDNVKAVYEGPSRNQYEVIKETGKVNELPRDEDRDDIPPENTIPTIWQQRGITSPNVKFDTLYYNGEEMERTDGTGVFFEGMTIGFYSNGDVCLNYNSDVISTKDSNGENEIGSNGAKSSSIDYYMTEGYGHCFDNGITMFLSADSGYITIRYTSSNTVNIYQGATLDSNGNVPENETCLIGTLLPQ